MGEIRFDPNRLIPAGRHRFQVIHPAESGDNHEERWRCVLCGLSVHPNAKEWADCVVGA